MPRRFASCLAVALALTATPLLGWGATGHRAIGQIATGHLSPAAAAAVGELLGPDSLAEVGDWSDDIRSDPAWKLADDWHWVTIPAGKGYDEAVKNPRGDLFVALDRFSAALADRARPVEERRQALRWISHLVGDFHQPLHVGSVDDRGGNDVLVLWFGEPSNLHTVWDSSMIDSTKLSYRELVEFIDPATPAEVTAWQASAPRAWAAESQELHPGLYELGDRRLSFKYRYDHLPTVEHRLLQAGVRLAGLLDRLLAPATPAAAPALPPAPRAKAVPHRLEAHGLARVDDYYWLRERENPEVVAYLEAENAYLDTVMAPQKALQATLFREITARLQPDDSSVPVRRDGYWYYTRFLAGGDYPLVCRRQGTMDAPEQVMLDGNALARGHGYFSLGTTTVTPSGRLLAYAVDTVGRRFYTLRFKDLATGETLADAIPEVTGNAVWANDDRTLFYSKQDPTTLRSFRIYRHLLGTDPARDELVYEEGDVTFDTYVFKTKSKRYVMISSSSTLANEYRYLDADRPGGAFTVVLPRERGHEHGVDHFGDRFYIRTNDGAKDFRLVSAPVATPDRAHWREEVPHRPGVLLADVEIFRDWLVLVERTDAVVQLRVRPWNGGAEHLVDFGEPVYAAGLGENPDFDTQLLRYHYSSLTTPDSTYDYDMARRERTLLKRDKVLGGFDPAAYTSERLWATARDGVRVPISIVFRRGFARDGRAPLLLYGYGSYGYSTDARFDAARLSLLDRGFAFAIAHVRGGSEMGRAWYDDGKLLKKKNTFTDFVDCADFLVRERYTSPGRLFALGGSAGGLLMGAIVNSRPELFRGVVAAVPFVDVVTTMLDASIPLTTSEYDEWGNPNDRTYYDYMLSYSPYDQVERKAYPNLLVTTGLHDSQVQYFEPAKWVAKLRTTKTDANLLLLHTNMEAGHGGTSGRLRRYHDTALNYAFMLRLAGIDR